MSNRIDEFADAFQSWLDEWKRDRLAQVSCGNGVQGEPATTLNCVHETPAGIQPYQGNDEPTMDDGASVPEPDWRDADVRPELERYRDQLK